MRVTAGEDLELMRKRRQTYQDATEGGRDWERDSEIERSGKLLGCICICDESRRCS